jgi:hypothetical protein
VPAFSSSDHLLTANWWSTWVASREAVPCGWFPTASLAGLRSPTSVGTDLSVEHLAKLTAADSSERLQMGEYGSPVKGQ